jgi:PAS domain S-box-containing protein
MRLNAPRVGDGQDCLASLPANIFMSTAFVIDSEFAVVLLTQEGAIVDAHPSCRESLGWSREELIGKDIGELLQSDRELLMSQLAQSKDAEIGVDGQTSFSIRILARRRDETSFPARVVVRRFDQNEFCTAAFYRVNPQNDSDTPPIVRSEEIELAARGKSQDAPQAAPEKPKSRWRNARLLFGSKTQPVVKPNAVEPPPSPAPSPVPSPLPVPAQKVMPPVPAQVGAPTAKAPVTPAPMKKVTPVFDSQVPQDIFLRRAPVAQEAPPAAPSWNVPVPAPAPESESVQEVRNVSAEESPEPEPAAIEEPILQEPIHPAPSEMPEMLPLAESRRPLPEEKEEDEEPTYEALLKEVEQEREERRQLEDRASALSAQVSSLHLQLSEHLDVEARNQKKVNGLEDQVRDSRNQITQLRNDLANERAATQTAQEKIEAANTVSTKLTEQLDSLKLVHEALGRTQAEAESQLQVVNKELKQTQDALASETAKRQELERELTAAKQEQAEHQRNAKLELSKLETALRSKDHDEKARAVTEAQEVLQAWS